MDLDLETFLIALYVLVDALSQSDLYPRMPVCGGPVAQRSDSEGLCLGLAGQWRRGVPWHSARGILRYVRPHRRHLFPTVLTPRAFNRRWRRLWGALILLQDAVAAPLAHGAYEVRDGLPIPGAQGARSFPPGWLADIARVGTGGQDRYFSGVRMMMGITQHGVATGGALASGNMQERWGAAWLCSIRAGGPGVQGPLPATRQQPKGPPPEEGRAAVPSGGAASPTPLLSDCGLRGDDWLEHWAHASGVHVCPRPNAAPRATHHWWRAARQGVETTWAHVTESVGRKYPGAHSTGGATDAGGGESGGL